VARHEAIVRICETVIELLGKTYTADSMDPTLAFTLSVPKNSTQNSATISTVFLSLYRVAPNGTPREPGGHLMKDGRWQKAQIPLDLHFLLTIWSDSSQTELSVAGWLMRAMEDNPILPASLLNGEGTNIFQPDETVKISLDELSIQDMTQLWESLTDSKYHLSIPYVARNVIIDSIVPTV